MSLYRMEIRDRVVNALRSAKTLAEDHVFVGMGLLEPLKPPAVVFVQIPLDRAESFGPNTPQFLRVATLAIRGFLKARDAFAVQERLDLLADQVERALFNSNALMSSIRQVRSYETEILVTLEGDRPVGELRVVADVEYDDVFAAPDGETLNALKAEMPPLCSGETIQLQI